MHLLHTHYWKFLVLSVRVPSSSSPPFHPLPSPSPPSPASSFSSSSSSPSSYSSSCMALQL